MLTYEQKRIIEGAIVWTLMFALSLAIWAGVVWCVYDILK